jgi:hypothetical protein
MGLSNKHLSKYYARITLMIAGAQRDPLAHFTFDRSVAEDSSWSGKLHLTHQTIRELSPASECKDLRCVEIADDVQLMLPAHNFGIYPALSFSMWFKPLAASGPSAHLLDFGNGNMMDNIAFGRAEATQKMVFYIVAPNGSPVSWTSEDDEWVADTWRHIVWSLEPVNATHSDWRVYFDGRLQGAYLGLYPVSEELKLNYLGKSNAAAAGKFLGYLDSVAIYSVALNSGEVNLVFKVGQTSVSHLFVSDFV